MSIIIIISLILSCIDNIVCEQNISYKFQNNNGLVLDEIFNSSMYIKSIVQSSRPMFLDIAIMLTKNACDYCRPKFPNARKYLSDLFRTASEIFALHRITLSVMHQAFCCLKIEDSPNHTLNTTGYENYFSFIPNLPDALVVFEDVVTSNHMDAEKLGEVCSLSGIAIVELCRQSDNDPYKAGIFLAHQLGHLLGLHHIEEKDSICKCGTPGLSFCVMYGGEYKMMADYPRSLTDCEMKKIKKNLDSYHCLLTKSKAPRLWGSCGDGVVGEGEDCDSGFLDKDNKLFSENECCDPKTCKYRQKEYKCWYGKCCKNCTIVSTKVCRKKVYECDFEEFCDGINPECPKDSYKMDYELCRSGQGFCHLKSCINMDAMCKIGYKNKNAYFSIYCAKMLNFIMEKKCSTLKNTTEFNKIVCSKKTPCEHFVCAIPNGFKLQGVLYFLGSERMERCLIPKQNNRKGLTSKASMYTNCGFDPKYPKFCHNLVCTNSSSVLKNCDNYTCRNMNVKFRSQIDPDSEISRYLNTGRYIFLSENEKDQFLQHSSKATISVIISIPVILLLSILILLKRNFLNFNKKNN